MREGVAAVSLGLGGEEERLGGEKGEDGRGGELASCP